MTSTPSRVSVCGMTAEMEGLGQDETVQKRKMARGGHGRRRALIGAGLPAFHGSQHGSSHHRRGESGHRRRDVLSSRRRGERFPTTSTPTALRHECTGTKSCLYQSLYYFNAATGVETPLLGTSYKWADGNLQLIVTTRSGVKWSDGTPFTAADVAFTLNYSRPTRPSTSTASGRAPSSR